MRRYEEDDFQDEDGTRDDYEDESDRDDRRYHQTKDRMAEDRAYWGDAEWRLAQIEGRLQPQREERIMETTVVIEVQWELDPELPFEEAPALRWDVPRSIYDDSYTEDGAIETWLSGESGWLVRAWRLAPAYADTERRQPPCPTSTETTPK